MSEEPSPHDEDTSELDAKLTAAHEIGHASAHREEAVQTTRVLIEKGFTPHERHTQTMGGTRNEEWWTKAPIFDWPSAVIVIALLIFVLIVVKIP